MNKKQTTEGLDMALDLLKKTVPPLNKRKEHQQAVEALESIKEWAAGASAELTRYKKKSPAPTSS